MGSPFHRSTLAATDLNALWAEEEAAQKVADAAKLRKAQEDDAARVLAERESERVKKTETAPAPPKKLETRKGINLFGDDFADLKGASPYVVPGLPAPAVDVQPPLPEKPTIGPKAKDASLPPPLASDLNLAWEKSDAEALAKAKNAGKR